MSNTDLELVQRVVQGDSGAFEVILEKYEKPIFNVTYRIVRNTDDAQDITQTVFIKVYERLDRYNPAHKLFSWLCKIAVNESLNHISRGKRTVDFEDNMASGGKSPEEQAAAGEKSYHLECALADLNLDYRIVIILKYFMELSYSDIGGILDIPEKTVKSRLYTGRQILKDTLRSRGFMN